MKIKSIFIVYIIFFVVCNAWAESEKPSYSNQVKENIFSDFKHFYSLKNQAFIGIGIAGAGIIANTSADENVQDWVQDSVVSEDTDDFSKVVKELGSWKKMTPVYLGLYGLGKIFEDTKIGKNTGSWSSETFRGLLVGMPSVLLWQITLGAARPSDEEDSKWHPFEDNNSASGHTFTGAVPFLTAAKNTDNIYIRSLLYLGSTFTGFSRINDHQHYLSQTILGWWLAYSAVESIYKTEKKRFTVMPIPVKEGFGAMVTFRF